MHHPSLLISAYITLTHFTRFIFCCGLIRTSPPCLYFISRKVRNPYRFHTICPSSQVENIVAAEYELEHLLLEGHCFDVTSGQPPRGLQFTLGTASEPVIVDTIVMANLASYDSFQSTEEICSTLIPFYLSLMVNSLFDITIT